jgi:hypothetical protein
MLDMYVAFYFTGKERWLLGRALEFGLEGLDLEVVDMEGAERDQGRWHGKKE